MWREPTKDMPFGFSCAWSSQFPETSVCMVRKPFTHASLCKVIYLFAEGVLINIVNKYNIYSFGTTIVFV